MAVLSIPSGTAADTHLIDAQLVSDVETFCPPDLTTEVFCFDCFTAGYCDGGKAVSHTCPAATPYCNNDACSKDRDMSWTMCDEQILEQQLSCHDEGYFPEPRDCQQFHLCPDPTIKPPLLRTTYYCPANYVYDAINFKCKQKVFAKDCVTVECNAANMFVTYPPNERYYGFCKEGGGSSPIMFKCASGHTFNLARLGCEFRCTKEGYFNGPKCNQYYLCYKSGIQLVARLDTCPAGYRWNQSVFLCQKDTAGLCKI